MLCNGNMGSSPLITVVYFSTETTHFENKKSGNFLSKFFFIGSGVDVIHTQYMCTFNMYVLCVYRMNYL